MPDFGFDAYAFEDPTSEGASHPLEIARDLIDAGKPRSALDILAEQHKRLCDDLDYLMLCGQAWFAAGDVPRAQHALLGAARVAPADPRPLRLLGELLLERGETDRARRLFKKAERLEQPEIEDPEPIERVASAPDLIAFAEQKERTRRAPARVGPLLWVIVAILGLGALVLVIDRSVSSRVAPADIADPVPSSEVNAAPAFPAPTPSPERAAPEPTPIVVPIEAAFRPPMAEPTPVVLEEPLVAPVVATPPSRALPRDKTRSREDAPKAAPRTKMKTRPPTPEPEAVAVRSEPELSDAELDAELAAGTNAAALTARGHELASQGQSPAAARFYRRALELDPDYAPALVAIGRSLLRAEKFAEAMRNATRALQFARGVDAQPGLEAEALYQIGRVRHQRGEEEAARELLRQSTSLPRAPAEAWFYLGESLAGDNSAAAREAYEEYLRRRPSGHLSGRARRAIQ